MAKEIKALAQLENELLRLPGIGRKSARRIAFHLLNRPEDQVRKLAQAILSAREKITTCPRCFNLAEGGLCHICSDAARGPELCVVENVSDLMAIEQIGTARWKYHVLCGVISPLDGVGPEDLKIRELLRRVEEESIREVTIATNFTVEGEATAMYLTRLLKQRSVRIFRIAHGLPVGGSLEHADRATMARAFEGRREL